jgi:hypothetical protein
MVDTSTWRGGAANSWDLRVLDFGNDMAKPLSAVLEQRQIIVRNALGYDCNQFTAGSVCFSAALRSTSSNGVKQDAAVFTAALAISDNLRLGIFADVAGNEVSATGIAADDRKALFGTFVEYNQNASGAGFNARVAVAYEDGNARFSHANLTGTGATASGDSRLSNVAAELRIGRGFKVTNTTLVTPQIGLVYTNAARAGYSDTANAGVVTTPITFDRFVIERLSVSVGAEIRGKFTEKFSYRVAASNEKDISYNVDNFTISGSFGNASFVGLPTRNSWRLHGSAEVGYAINDRLSLVVNNTVRRLYNADKLNNTISAGILASF